MRRLALATAFIIGIAAPALAEQGGESISTQEFRSANLRMQMDWGVRLSGNADRDFAASMLRQQENAIALAQIQLGHGSDPRMRQLAEDMIRQRQAEIAELRDYLARSVRLD